MTRYVFAISRWQLFMSSLMVGVAAAAIIMINMFVMEYLQLPIVHMSNNNCSLVSNFRNGDAFTCADVDVILRKYRVEHAEIR